MSIQHKDITGADVHEPKGIATATNGQTYVANGSGSGAWANPLTNVKNLNIFIRDSVLADVGTVNDRTLLPIPAACTLTKLSAVLSTTVDTTSTVLSLYRNGVLLGQSLTLLSAGSGLGVVNTVSFSPTYVFTPGQTLEIRSDGACANTQRVNLTFEFTAN